MNYSMIVNIVGKVICVEAAFMLPALVIAFACGESSAALGFGLSMAVILALGLPLGLIRPKRSEIFAREGMVTVGLTWIVVSLLGALPFCISGAIPNYIDCIFETVSGFTTTGASVLPEVESLPRSILYWRSFSHWLGGMGVLVFVMILNPLAKKNSGENIHLLRAESPGIRISKLVPRMKQSAAILYLIYIALTVLQFLLLWLGKMPVFDAVTLTFGTAGTGGFGVMNDSIASYSPYCQWVITVFMLLFSVNFNVYFLILLREFKKAFKNEELIVFALMVVAAIVMICINLRGVYASGEETIRTVAFQVAAIVSTTGYSTVNFDLWPQFSRTIMFLLLFCGACAGSTGGGFKVVRAMIVAKTAGRSVRQAAHPNAVRLIHMDGEVVDEKTVSAVSAYTLVYILILVIATLLITFDGLDFATNFSAAATCLNNVGPGMNMVGPAMNFSCYSWFSKLVLSVVMLVGRLEIYPMLVLFALPLRRK